MPIHKTDKEGYGIWQCQYCNFTAPKGHWRPKTYIEKHEENCPSKPR
ncbi:eL43 family ribosomal protein [Nonlabens xiamenensis]